MIAKAMFDIWPGVNLSRFLPSTVSKLLLIIARHRVKRSNMHETFAVKYTHFVCSVVKSPS